MYWYKYVPTNGMVSNIYIKNISNLVTINSTIHFIANYSNCFNCYFLVPINITVVNIKCIHKNVSIIINRRLINIIYYNFSK